MGDKRQTQEKGHGETEAEAAVTRLQTRSDGTTRGWKRQRRFQTCPPENSLLWKPPAVELCHGSSPIPPIAVQSGRLRLGVGGSMWQVQSGARARWDASCPQDWCMGEVGFSWRDQANHAPPCSCWRLSSEQERWLLPGSSSLYPRLRLDIAAALGWSVCPALPGKSQAFTGGEPGL